MANPLPGSIPLALYLWGGGFQNNEGSAGWGRITPPVDTDWYFYFQLQGVMYGFTMPVTGSYSFGAKIAIATFQVPSGGLICPRVGWVHCDSSFDTIESQFSQSFTIAPTSAPSADDEQFFYANLSTIFNCAAGDIVFPVLFDMNPTGEGPTSNLIVVSDGDAATYGGTTYMTCNQTG